MLDEVVVVCLDEVRDNVVLGLEGEPTQFF